MNQIEKIVLDNGARILLEPNDQVRSAAVGLWCQTGSRHERQGEEGITHFIEHMLFKGTGTRSARQIAESVEGRGGVLNAFTDKEQTCYYCRVLGDDVVNGLEVLGDMLTNSVLDPEEITRECGVIQEEIKRGEDEPGDHVHELHIQGRWEPHELGKPIIGTSESVASFRRENFVDYMQRQYRSESIVLGIAGYMDRDAVLKVAVPLLESIPSGLEKPEHTVPPARVQQREIGKDVEQVHFCIGTDGCSITDPKLYTFAVLDSILGGGMSGRLFQEVRERRGLAYSVGSYTLSYSSAGLYTIYGGTGKQTWGQVQEVIHNELEKIRNEVVPSEELDRVKRMLKGNMVLALEGMNSRMARMVKNELNHGRDVSIDETMQKVDAVSAKNVQDLAQEIFAPGRLSLTAIGPFA
jgi:predicted Zn-dependent peptidase